MQTNIIYINGLSSVKSKDSVRLYFLRVSKIYSQYAGFERLTAVTTKSAIF
jgi:hypothetical protein